MALIKCPECKKEVSDTAKNCIHCGGSLEKKEVCPECGKEVSVNDKVCQNCGCELKKSVIENVKKNNSLKIIIPVVAVLIIAIIVVIIFVVSGNKVNLSDAYYNAGCDTYYCELAKDGSYLEVDTNPSDLDDYYNATAVGYVESINTELGFSSALFARMERTRALDGTLTDENEYVSVSWTYHPDKGLSVVYTLK